MISTILYYIMYSSAVLIYGIGIERTAVLCRKKNNLFLVFIKMLISVVSTAVISFWFVNGILVPAGLHELFPLFVLLLFLALSVFTEAIIRITAKISACEFGISVVFIFLGLTEATSIGECILISAASIMTFFSGIIFMYAINRRMELNEQKQEYEKLGHILVSLAVVMVIFLVWNVSWINTGVLK